MWSNGEDDSPVATVSSADSPSVQPRSALDPSSKSEPSGPPPAATFVPPSTPRVLKSRGSSPVHPSSQCQSSVPVDHTAC